MQCNNPGRYVSNITRIANAVWIKLFIDGFAEIDRFFLTNCHNSHKGFKNLKIKTQGLHALMTMIQFCADDEDLVLSLCMVLAEGQRGSWEWGEPDNPKPTFFNRTMMMS